MINSTGHLMRHSSGYLQKKRYRFFGIPPEEAVPLHTYRTSGGNCHYRHTCGDAASGTSKRQSPGQKQQLYQQS